MLTSHMCQAPAKSSGVEASACCAKCICCMRAQAGRQQLQDAASAWMRGPPDRPASAPAPRPANAGSAGVTAGVTDEESLCPEVPH